jgi:hypothetical protein
LTTAEPNDASDGEVKHGEGYQMDTEVVVAIVSAAGPWTKERVYRSG